MGLSRGSRASNVGSAWREVQGVSPIPGLSYPVGTLVEIAGLDQQVWSDFRTVRPTPASATVRPVFGVIADEFITSPGVTIPGAAPQGGFGGGSSLAPGSTSSAPLGTDAIPCVVRGIVLRALIDNTNGAAAITHGLPLSSASNVVGKMMQGPATPIEGAFSASALLNAAAPFNTLGSGAVAAATQTITVGGTPATGDTYNIPVQVPFNANNQGVANYRTVTVGPLTAAQAASTTTAAAAIVAAINADTIASVWYTAANAANVVTLTVNAGNQFRIGGQGYNQGGFYWGSNWELTTTGTVGNSLSLGALTVVTGGATLTAGGAAANYTGYPTGATLFSGGTGYVGTCPVFVGGIFG